MKSILEKAVKAYYGYDIETYQLCLSELENRINGEECECKKCAHRGEYNLVRSLAYLNMPKKLCEFYDEAVKNGVKTEIFDISETYLLAWAYEDLIEYFGMPLEKADGVAQELTKAVALHAGISSCSRGTDLLYRAEVALRRGEHEKALYYSREAKKILPEKNSAAHACSARIAESAYKKIRFE
ncbi:MAG: hypothetical protein IJ021_01475 [Clostridia bacterium]|nr:hypothetical protein [Clostridia bacterium]